METLRERYARRSIAIAAAVLTATMYGSVGTSGQGAPCTVTSGSDSGPGTLRAHLADAGCAVIVFEGLLVHGSQVATPLIVGRDVTIKGPWTLPDAYLAPDRFAVIGYGSRVFEVLSDAHVVIAGLGFSGADAPAGGGVILNRGTLTVTDSEFVYNGATPAIDPEFGVVLSNGGAIANIGTLTVTRSRFNSNRATKGGAIYNRGTLTVVNSSFDANSGSAIHNVGMLTLANTTIAQTRGVGLWDDQAITHIKNSIIADNWGGNCRREESALFLQGVNLDTDGTCHNFGHVSSEELRLQGTGRAAELLDGSVAIDAVADCTLPDGVTPVGSDERGFARPQGAFCDAGSFEFVSPFVFSGFLAPLHNTGSNAMKAGRTVAVNFSLGGNRGLGVLVPGFPASRQVECGPSDSTEIGETTASGSSTLSYDLASDTYTYLWSTEASWANTCRDLTLQFVDGSTQQVRFRFRR
jgi:predicted outer membrane repeat protein